MKRNSLKSYLQDPFLKSLMSDIRSAGGMRSSLLDITHKCNLRCTGCYYFAEQMDQYKKENSEYAFLDFVRNEASRGINMLTIVGGEPALEIDRLRILAKHFKLIVVTNGSIPIPKDGLEDIRIAISFWGDEEQDTILRGNGKHSIFEKSLSNFHNDPRVGFYYTTIHGYVKNIARVTERMIENGNFVSFNFYADLAQRGGKYSHKKPFNEVNCEIERLTRCFPENIVSSPYINKVISSRQLLGNKWGYNVCPSVTYDHPLNKHRMATGKHYPTQFRAYNADLKTTRRCCIGSSRECDTCVDLWAIYGWVLGSMKEHLTTKKDFTNWLCTTFIFYMQSGFLDWNINSSLLPEIYKSFQSASR